jgi:hypothetical protein
VPQLLAEVMMQRIAFLLAILSAPPSFAETAQRCGTDAFGNTVCMDKDGVVSIMPRSSSEDHPAGGDRGNAASAVEADGKADARQTPRRCGVDPFGNTVCN